MGVGLILEGGGMRGVYSSGVLDCLLNNNLMIKNIYAVSAGAANGVSYVSKQPRRSFKINIRFCHDKRYLDLLGAFNEEMFKMDFAFKTIPEQYYSFDNETFKSSESTITVVTTDCISGDAAYFVVDDMDIDYPKVMASCSLPVVSKPVILDGVPHMDGGIADPIPLQYSMDCGNDKNIVILTRPALYQKKPEGKASSVLGRIKYKHYPNLLKTAARRSSVYNKQLKLVEQQELEGNAVVIRPQNSFDVERTERNPVKLMNLYRAGYLDCQKNIDLIKNFIKE